MNDRIFWQLVRNARLRRGIKQTEAARRLGMAQSNLSRLESGRDAIGEDKLLAIARAYDTTLRQLLLEELSSPAPEPKKGRPAKKIE